MKILLLNTNDISGGAARAAYRLHTGLLSHGIDVTYLVKNKNSTLESIITVTDDKYKLKSKINGRLNNYLIKKYKRKDNTLFSADLFSTNIHRIINQMDVDIIHLHWINGFVDIKSIGKINKPIVWTLHDMWPFTGGCHYDKGCGKYQNKCQKCPLLNSNQENDLSKKIFKQKVTTYKKIENLTVIGVSKWIADCAKKSELFKNKKIVNLPNLINTEEFEPVSKENARAILNLPIDKKIILFGAMDANSDKRKGYEYLKEALKNISIPKKELEIVIFGSSKIEIKSEYGIKTRYIGSLSDNLSLKLLYSAADVMVVPSLQETFGQTASESMSCGIPVVSFRSTGLIDIVVHKKNGYLAEPFESEDLIKGIEWILEDKERHKQLSYNARQKVLENFDSEVVIPKYVELYKSINKHK